MAERAPLSLIYSRFLAGSGVCTDTRKLQAGEVFFALKGPSFDGNRYALKALEAGASAAVVDDPVVVVDDRFLLVDDALVALQNLATHHRREWGGTVIGLTGSNGKTTTKELTHVVLSATHNTLATIGNLNNHIGVPLTLLRLRPEHQLAVIEMGANHQGDIQELCEIAEPDLGFITNIGKAHLETFGGLEGVAKGKSEMYRYLAPRGGTILVNASDPKLMELSEGLSGRLLYQTKGSPVLLELLESEPQVIYSDGFGHRVKTHLSGSYQLGNLAAALAVGHHFGVPLDRAHEAVADYVPQNMRGQLIECGSVRVMLDAYNANPTSMEAALRSFAAMPWDGPKIPVLGDMLELGDDAPMEHAAMVRLCNDLGFETAAFVGPIFSNAKRVSNEGYRYFAHLDGLRTWVRTANLTGAMLWLKASRGMALEQLLDELPS